MDDGVRQRAPHRRAARPHHSPCPYPGDERRELPAQAEPVTTPATVRITPRLTPWAHRPLPRAGRRQPRGGRIAPRAGPSRGLPGQAATEPVGHFCAAAPVHFYAAVDNPAFGRAFQAFDGAIWAHSAGSALVTVWAALETLIQPGQSQITKRLASSLAALLEPPGPERSRVFGQIKSLYEARGGAAHASRTPQDQQLLSSFGIGRRVFVSCIDRANVAEIC